MIKKVDINDTSMYLSTTTYHFNFPRDIFLKVTISAQEKFDGSCVFM
ncbi:hypothetical protein SDC9_155679 [bioreactor metagenome]|uniref:Uncharacterized protein n=1 Tax=bioreactor metagenome TaxID=1076179 RepID=A0A645F2E5_9ZZZZ